MACAMQNRADLVRILLNKGMVPSMGELFWALNREGGDPPGTACLFLGEVRDLGQSWL